MPDTRSERPDNRDNRTATDATRRAWARPTLTSYGPIGRLTQGLSGIRSDTGGRKP